MGVRDALDFGDRRGMRLGAAIRPVRSDRVVRIRDGEQARAKHDRLALQTRGVPAPVEPLLVLQDDLARFSQELDSLEQRPPEARVLAHLDPFLLIERPGLEQHGVAHADLADVVQQRAHFDRAQLALVVDAQHFR